jgi:hypothetical protein
MMAEKEPMMKFKILTAVAAAALVPSAVLAADCCQPSAECCKDGKDCCDEATKPEQAHVHR